MPFEINLQAFIHVSMLRQAGMEVDALQDLEHKIMMRKAKVPAEVKLPYFLARPPATIRVTLLEDEKITRLRIAAEDAAIERKIRKVLERYSAENDGEAALDREHKEAWKQINAILAREKLTYQQVSHRQALLNRRAIEGLIKLAGKLEPHQVHSVYCVFSNGPAARADKEPAVRWLMKRLANEPDPDTRGELGLRVWENVVPAVRDEILQLMERQIRQYGSAEAGLIMALAQTKHPRAADFIASHLDKPDMLWAGLQALGKLKATQHADKIRPYLRDPDADIRREAKKALKKLGVPIETPPAPVHLVKGKAKIPKNLEEWSQNLDMHDLKPVLRRLSKSVDGGFGASEVAEVLGVVEEMRPEQTRSFRFPISAAKKPGELWLVIFMDDVDSPDLEVHAAPAVLKRFAPLVPLD